MGVFRLSFMQDDFPSIHLLTHSPIPPSPHSPITPFFMSRTKFQPLDDRGPLRTLFALTSMPVGGAERLLQNLVLRLDRDRILPEICCLKKKDVLGEILAQEIPVHSELLTSKFDLRVVWRVKRLMRRRRIDAVVTVGSGDNMFWGRIAAKLAGVPVVVSALHSTGWPDGVGRLNRLLTPVTDAFIAVARDHARFLVEESGFPADRVRLIPNGVDTERFQRVVDCRAMREELGIPEASPVVGIVAALRPEKNHPLFLQMAQRLVPDVPDAHFLMVGDGPERSRLEWLSRELGVANQVHFCGTRQNIPAVLSTMNVFVLTSHIEANPVSILEAMSVGLPVIATDVGSVHETVQDASTGYLVPAGDAGALATRAGELLADPVLARECGDRGRQLVRDCWSLNAMVRGYEDLLTGIYRQKVGGEALVNQPPVQPREYAPPERVT